jgi:hypothetical protein
LYIGKINLKNNQLITYSHSVILTEYIWQIENLIEEKK